MGFSPFGGLPQLAMQAATPAAGYAYVNGTGTVISWTAPSDGQLHRVMIFGLIHVTAAQTGGALQVTGISPDGAAWTQNYDGGAHGIGVQHPNPASSTNQMFLIVGAGTTVTLLQSSALTVGAAVLWAEIWGA